MPHDFQIHKQDATYFLTMTAIEWVDAFSRIEHKDLLCDSLNHNVNKKGLEIFAYVIMSNHMHMITRAKEGNLSNVIRDFKKFTSGTLMHAIEFGRESRKEWMMEMFSRGGQKQKKKSKRQLWQYNNHAEEVYSPKFTLTKINYIHYNPVEAGLVDRPEHYRYSSAIDYAGGKGPVEVSVLNLHNLFY
jgi:REP element-mobilizing transposase RayT